MASFCLSDKPAEEVVNTRAGGRDNSDQKQDQACHNEFEFLIAILVGRRKLVLRKIWRWTIHGSSLTFKVQSSKLLPIGTLILNFEL